MQTFNIKFRMAVSLIKKLSTAELAYKNLNGIFCIYKPPDMDLYDIIDQLKTNLTDGINKLPSRPVEKIVKIDEFNDKPTLAFNYADTVQGKFNKKIYSISINDKALCNQ